MSNGFQQFGFGEKDEGFGRKSKRLKMEKGEEARISFIWWPGLDKGKPNLQAATPIFVGGPRHYLKGVGYFMNKGPEYTKIAGEAPKMRINTIIVKWPSKGGKTDQEAIKEGNFEVLYWIMDDGKYDELKPIHQEWPFGAHDLKLKCSDAQFQKMSFSPTKDSVLAALALHPESTVWQSLVASAQAFIAGAQDEIGKEMTLDQIREKLAGGGGGGGGGGSAVSAVSGDMDEALNNFLED